MALTLAQALDLAISADIASVNFLHLRDVLTTVITTLDIGGTSVRSERENLPSVDENEDNTEENTSSLSENEDEDIGTSGDNNKEYLGDELESDAFNVKNEENKRKYVNPAEECLKESPSLRKQSSRAKSIKEDGVRRRNESSVSKISNAAVANNSVLFSKICALEEGLSRLRSIVGDLIARSNFGGNLGDSLMEQLKEAEKEMEETTAGLVEENNTSSQDVDVKGGDTQRTSSVMRSRSTELKRDVSGKKTSKRPVTQPASVSRDRGRKPVALTRSKTEDVLRGGKIGGATGKEGKGLSRKVSVLEKLKQRRRVSMVTEETAEVGSDEKETVGNTKDPTGETVESGDTRTEAKTGDDECGTSGDTSDGSEDETENEEELEEMIQGEIEAVLNDPDDPGGPAYAVRLGLEQMQHWREKIAAAQEEFRSEVEACKSSIQTMHGDLQAFRSAKKVQDAERFNAVHHVHGLVLELDSKQAKLSKTVNELVDEFNRHEKTFGDIFDTVEKLDEQKVDKLLLSSQVGTKANKEDLRDKVSVSTFDETFSLLDRGLGDALEKMANQMSMEEALRETLNEMQSGMELKLDRDEMEHLRRELEARIKEVQSTRDKALVGKPETHGDPAGFKRKTEKVRCISCDRDLEIETSQVQPLPSIPKAQPLAGKSIPSRDGNVMKKATDDEYGLSRSKSDIVKGTGLLDFPSFPMSQRFCGGRHTIMRPNKRSLVSSHFNDFVLIRNESESLVSLPAREYVVPRDSIMARFMKQKLPSINEMKPLPDIQDGRNENAGLLSETGESTKRVESQNKTRSAIIGKIPSCKNDE